MSITTEELKKLLSRATPANWRVYKGTSVHPSFDGASPQTTNADTVVCDCFGPDAAANARLIALAPDLARRIIAAEKLAILLRATSAMIEDSMKNVRDERGFVFIPGVSDLEITPDGSLKLSHIRAALSEWEALQ